MNSQGDEITTIFVVGFPDDIKEREFQNMFIFSQGFEAATLKIPCLDEVDKEMSSSGKKQIIGFAKFQTRKEALEARDILTGRKVDAEKNCILKAEMAKKNLHTKRGLSSMSGGGGGGSGSSASNSSSSHLNSALNSGVGTATSTSSASGSGVSNNNGSTTVSNGNSIISNSSNPAIAAAAAAAVAATTAVSATAVNGGYPGSNGGMTTVEPQSAFALPRGLSGLGATGIAPVRPLNLAGTRAFDPFNDRSLNSAPIQGSLLGISSDRTPAPYGLFEEPMTALDPNGSISRRTSFHNIVNSRGIGLNLPKAPGDRRNTGDLPTPGTATQTHPLDLGPMQSRLASLSINPLGAHQSGMVSPLPTLTGHHQPGPTMIQTPQGLSIPAATTRSVNSNDQNPPCNTLYVGNLPVNTKEEELRNLFQRAHGYKRMSFRTKPNSGPMCFVEFDDITCATLALRELDGQRLSNSTSSGIRLSYSKNPLGVRSQNNPNNYQQQQQQHHHHHHQQHHPPSSTGHSIKQQQQHLNGSSVDSTVQTFHSAGIIHSHVPPPLASPSVTNSATSFLDTVVGLSQGGHHTPLPISEAVGSHSPIVAKGSSPLSRGSTTLTNDL